MSSTPELHVEATGETVGEAKWSALRELEKLQPGLDKGAVRFEVVSEGERGLLGVGYAPARVIATVDPTAAKPPAPPSRARDESELAGQVRSLVERITRGLGLSPRIDISESPDSLVASCSGRDIGLLIGKRGQTIDAIQYLVNAIVMKRSGEVEKPIVVDAGGYRERRQRTLDSLAVRSAEQAVTSRAEVALEPMTAVERKIVHVRLKGYPGVETLSRGTEPNRAVVIVPAATVEQVGEPGASAD
jgi:spoIIIJ-associated protein